MYNPPRENNFIKKRKNRRRNVITFGFATWKFRLWSIKNIDIENNKLKTKNILLKKKIHGETSTHFRRLDDHLYYIENVEYKVL